VLATIFRNTDIEVRSGRVGPDACSNAYWADASAPEVVFRVLVLLVWLGATLWLVYRRTLPPVDRLVVRVCRSPGDDDTG
jgi:hypothetical protein